MVTRMLRGPGWEVEGPDDLVELANDDPSAVIFIREDSVVRAVTVDRYPVPPDLAVDAALGQRSRPYRDRPGFEVLADARVEVPGGRDGRALSFVGAADDLGSDPSVVTLVAARSVDGCVVTANSVRPVEQDGLADAARRFVTSLRLV